MLTAVRIVWLVVMVIDAFVGIGLGDKKKGDVVFSLVLYGVSSVCLFASLYL